MSIPLTGPLCDYESRVVSLLGRIEWAHIDLAIDQLLRLDADSQETITIFVSCQGGQIIEGLKLADIVTLLRSPLTVVGFGLIEGAAIMLLVAAPDRVLFPSAIVSTAGVWDLPHLHPQARSPIGLHQQSSMDDQLRQKLVQRVNEVISKCSHSISASLFEPETVPKIFTAAECVQCGLADDIVHGPDRLRQRNLKPKYSHESTRLSH